MNRIKAFYKKNEDVIIVAASGLVSITIVTMSANKAIKGMRITGLGSRTAENGDLVVRVFHANGNAQDWSLPAK